MYVYKLFLYVCINYAQIILIKSMPGYSCQRPIRFIYSTAMSNANVRQPLRICKHWGLYSSQ